MPLDTHAAAVVQSRSRANDGLAPLRPARIVLSPDGDVGEALRAAREKLGLAVEDIAQATRVRAAHIAALERFDLEALPSRPFAVGFVRAYARALGLEPEAVVARFRAEAPRVDDALRGPGGLHLQGRHRTGWIAIATILVLGAVMTWNVARRAAIAQRYARADAIGAPAPPTPPAAGAARLGPPLPAPPEAAAPPAYQTPGLGPTPSLEAAPAPEAEAASTAGRIFVAAGTIFGAPAAASGITLQATKPASLIVRGAGGAVYFARQLAAGEAWRGPALAGLTVDVSNPAAVEVFAGGVSRGPLARAQTPLSSLER
jgi:cytoskeleton protein RodZ